MYTKALPPIIRRRCDFNPDTSDSLTDIMPSLLVIIESFAAICRTRKLSFFWHSMSSNLYVLITESCEAIMVSLIADSALH